MLDCRQVTTSPWRPCGGRSSALWPLRLFSARSIHSATITSSCSTLTIRLRGTLSNSFHLFCSECLGCVVGPCNVFFCLCSVCELKCCYVTGLRIYFITCCVMFIMTGHMGCYVHQVQHSLLPLQEDKHSRPLPNHGGSDACTFSIFINTNRSLMEVGLPKCVLCMTRCWLWYLSMQSCHILTLTQGECVLQYYS